MLHLNTNNMNNKIHLNFRTTKQQVDISCSWYLRGRHKEGRCRSCFVSRHASSLRPRQLVEPKGDTICIQRRCIVRKYEYNFISMHKLFEQLLTGLTAQVVVALLQIARSSQTCVMNKMLYNYSTQSKHFFLL